MSDIGFETTKSIMQPILDVGHDAAAYMRIRVSLEHIVNNCDSATREELEFYRTCSEFSRICERALE